MTRRLASHVITVTAALLLALAMALAMSLALALPAQAQEFIEGEHYDLIAPAIRTTSGDKIEVTEFFAYSCGHCYNFDPVLAKWKSTLPDDVAFRGSPAVWNGLMEVHAKAFYAAEALDVLDKMHIPLFQAIIVDRKTMRMNWRTCSPPTAWRARTSARRSTPSVSAARCARPTPAPARRASPARRK
jgi:thiol-disulfide isomerase/thioredoxin